ncbi:MAG: alpha/beta hydrolase [Ferruginibacter sp.]|nr:alpha/beta hydrolase [Rhodoferax sp.]
MTEPCLCYVPCPGAAAKTNAPDHTGHRMAYWQWGDPANPHVVVCAHGLTRQGRDFDVLAQSLSRFARVICPDVAGRGRSDWLQDPQAYQLPTYAGDMLALLARVHGEAPITTLDWLGTSMGGLIGMALLGTPGLPLPVPVRRLVLNDIGPTLDVAALERIASYLGKTGRFDTLQQAADAMSLISRSFGPHTPAQWLALSKHMVRPLVNGEPALTLHYDPALAAAFKTFTAESAAAGEAALWALYDQITAQTLLLRGSESDLLSATTARAMVQRGPRARLVEFAGVGHAPTFVTADQIAAVVGFLQPL